MAKVKTYTIAESSKKASKISDYLELVKVRLTLLVVFTSIFSYLIVAGSAVQWISIFLLGFGGFLVAGAANALNQVLEREFDSMMKRTANRPVTAKRMKASEAVLFSGLSALVGVTILAFFNPLTGLLSMLSLILYAFVYTPMKRYSPLAVGVGAIPGALPAMIGATAFEGYISAFALGIFAIQFLWQFPHFWAIGFLSFDEYKKAGFKLLPEGENGVDRNLGLHSILYVLLIFPVIALLYHYGEVSMTSSVLAVGLSFVYLIFSIKFHFDFDRKSGLALMFSSFFYLPLVLAAYYFF